MKKRQTNKKYNSNNPYKTKSLKYTYSFKDYQYQKKFEEFLDRTTIMFDNFDINYNNKPISKYMVDKIMRGDYHNALIENLSNYENINILTLQAEAAKSKKLINDYTVKHSEKIYSDIERVSRNDIGRLMRQIKLLNRLLVQDMYKYNIVYYSSYGEG